MRLTAVKVLFLWTAVDIVYYGIALIPTSLKGGSDISNVFIFACLECLALVLYPFFINLPKIGRKNGAIISFGTILLCMTVAMGADSLSCGKTWGIQVQRFCFFISKFAVSGTYTLIYTWTGETFPTPLRANILGAGVIWAKGASILTPVIVALREVNEWIPMIIFCVFSISNDRLRE